MNLAVNAGPCQALLIYGSCDMFASASRLSMLNAWLPAGQSQMGVGMYTSVRLYHCPISHIQEHV